MLQFAGGNCSVHQALLHCQPRLFHLGNAPTYQYKDSTQALFSYKSTSSSMSILGSRASARAKLISCR